MKFRFEKSRPQGVFEGISLTDWHDWRWQLKNSLKTEADFAKLYNLSEGERAGFRESKNIFQIRSTPYYACLADPAEARDPLRLIQTPDHIETKFNYQEMLDPLGEEKNSVSPRLIHRYYDRVLFLVTDFCSVYCRFCTRKRFTGNMQSFLTEAEYEQSLKYIRDHQQIREVILSGGDPLTLSDERLDRVLTDLRKIEHIEIIRIGSRMPVVNPFRISKELVSILQKNKPIFFMNHFNHPREITYEAAKALELLVDSGVPLLNQMVLLNGINNSAAHVQALSRRLLYLRVKPYYMFQCDPSEGTDHLRTSIVDSLSIQRELWGHLSGLAMPQFSIDIPDGGGKTSMAPNFRINEEGLMTHPPQDGVWRFRGFDGVESEYIDPASKDIIKPIDLNIYAQEWR